MLEGKVIGRCVQRHRHEEFMRFLNIINAETLAGKTIRVILDNYAAHKHPAVLACLARHKRFFFHSGMRKTARVITGLIRYVSQGRRGKRIRTRSSRVSYATTKG